MPAELLKARWKSRPADMSDSEWVQATANHFRVSTPALFWRMVALGLYHKKQRENFLMKSNSLEPMPKPAWFSRRFLEGVGWGIDRGEVSVRRTLAILGMDLGEFRSQCEAHGLEVTIGI